MCSLNSYAGLVRVGRATCKLVIYGLVALIPAPTVCTLKCPWARHPKDQAAPCVAAANHLCMKVCVHG